MWKGVLAFVVLFCRVSAEAKCPIDIVSTAADSDSISLNFRNIGKLPIRRIEFNCSTIPAKAHKAKAGMCVERNALFFPGYPYTLSYPYPNIHPEPVLISLKHLTLSDGFIWKPTKNEPCQTLRIQPENPKK